jgi:non-ribosomal peptide synthetase component F
LSASSRPGSAYLPLDPDYPPERLAFMQADVGAPVLLTRAALRAHLQSHDAAWCLDADWRAIARPPATVPRAVLHPQNIDYVASTSGSTETPKGAVINHHNVVRLVKNANHFELTT